MNKKRLVSYSFVFLAILLSVLLVKAAIDIRSVTLNTPANNQWISNAALIGGSIAQFNCTANSDNALVNLTFWTNVAGGAFQLNQSNLTAVSNNTAYNFSIPNPPQNNTGIIWNCQAWNGTLGSASNNSFASSNFTFYVDTIVPVPDFNAGTTENRVNGSILDIKSILVNLTITEANIANVTFVLYNGTGLVRNITNYTGPTTLGIRSINFTSNGTFTLSDDTYYFNATVVDNATNANYTVTRQITIDTTTPVPDFNTGTTEGKANNSYLNIKSILVNLTITEANIANVTFVLYNGTGLVRNITNYTGPTTLGIRSINFTSNGTFTFSDDTYYFNATVVDNVTRINYTVTRQITLDTKLPTLDHQGASDANSTSATSGTLRNWTYVNFSVTEVNPANITFTLYNSSNTSAYFLVNTTVRYLSGNAGLLANTSINFSDLKMNSVYYYNATITDLANNINASVLRRFILDNTTPLWSSTTINQTSIASTMWVNFSSNWTDNIELAGFIFSINMTGLNFTNSSYIPLSIGRNITTEFSNVTLINTGNKQNVTWLFYVNDTAGNWNQTALQSFITADSGSSGGSSGGGGGGGGGGGSSGTAPSTPNALHSETHTITKITPGAATIIKIVDPELGLKEIQVIVNHESSAVKITVTKLEGKPAVVTHEINNSNVYKYFEVNKTNLADTDLQQAKLSVKVEKSFLDNNKYDKNKVVVQRYNQVTGWNRLDTKVNSEDDKFVYYDATSPGFSIFAITVDQPAPQPTTQETTTTEPTTTQEPPISVPPKKKSYVWAWIISIIGVIGIVILVFFLVQKQKRKR